MKGEGRVGAAMMEDPEGKEGAAMTGEGRFCREMRRKKKGAAMKEDHEGRGGIAMSSERMS